MSHFVDIPRSFQPLEFLSGRLSLRSDDARWLVSTILRKTANRDVDVWGLVRLDARILRRVMAHHDYSRVIAALSDGGAIEVANYAAGVKTKGFRLAKRYLGDRCVRMPIHDPRLVERIERERERQQLEEQKTRWRPIHFALHNEQQAISIDDAADAVLDTLPAHTRLCQDVLVGNIRRREYPFSVGSTGRVFNAVTGLKRELRQHLRFDGEHVASVDLGCAQPALLGAMLTGKYPPSVPKPCATYKHGDSDVLALPLPASTCLSAGAGELRRFVGCVVDGSFYDRLASFSGLSRDVVKLRFLVDVLAKKGRYPSEVEDAFRGLYPSIWKAIRTINKDDHGTLIRVLQQAESWLVVDNVAPALLKRRQRVVTLHDAIYSHRRQVGIVQQTFRDVLKDLGIQLSMKVEHES